MKFKILFCCFITIFLFLRCKEKNNETTLEKKISAVTKDLKATVGVSVMGIEDDFEFNNENAQKNMPMLSVFKLPLAIAILHEVDEEKLDLNQEIFIQKEELLPNTWSPIREKYPEGNIHLSLAELIEYTVAQSDNNGADILLRLIGGPKKVQDFIQSHGISDFQLKYNEAKMRSEENVYQNYATPQAITQLLKAFYNGEVISEPSTDFLLNIMTNTSTGTEKLPKLLPNVTMARKTGASGRNNLGKVIAENDCGIVTLPNGKHYAITVFIEDSMESDETNYHTIAEISKQVYDFLNDKKQLKNN